MALFGGFKFGTKVFGPGTGAIVACQNLDIVTVVQTMLNESGSGIFWPVQQVYDAVNDSLLEMESIAYLPVATATMTFTKGQDLVAWPNTTIMWPHYIESNGREYWPVTHAELERYDRNWRSATQDQPRFFVLWDEAHFRPYPLADQTYTYNVWGPGWPTEVVSTNTDFTAPPLLKLAVAFRASARLFEYSRPDLAKQCLLEADEYEKKFRMQSRRNQGDNMKRIRPGTALTHAQAGNIRIAKRIDGNPSNPYR